LTAGLLVAVAVGGLIGAPTRYLVDRAITARIATERPWGTVIVNISGSLLLGLLAGLSLARHLPITAGALFGDGFCGAYTTFSTFTYETVRLVEDGDLLEAATNVAVSVAGGLAAAAAGVAVGLHL
jgi:CrcB protein